MNMVFDSILIGIMQRKPCADSLLVATYRYLIPGKIKNWLFHKYKQVWNEYSNRRKLDMQFWGREGGYKHGQSVFKYDEIVWRKTYGMFYDETVDNLVDGQFVVELGCSAGQWANRLKLNQRNVKYIGVDINKKNIEFASNYFRESSNISFFAKDVRDVEELRQADLVLVCQTFFFLDSCSIREILSKIKPGAMIIIGEPVNSGYKAQTESESLEHESSVGFSHNFFNLLKDSGFDVLKDTCMSKGKVLLLARKKAVS